jgi:spermidine synthase
MEFVEVARAASDRGDVVLRRRTDPQRPEDPSVLELRVNGVFVMDTFETRTEVTLARAALEEVEHPRRVLVGGLGLGFTVHEVLADSRVDQVVVAEVEDALVRWFRDGTVPHGPAYLADERLRITVADVRLVVQEAGDATYDLVLLDVDNGPDFLVYEDNAELYEPAFLEQARRALAPGGRLVVWSSTRAHALEEAMGSAFGTCEVIDLPVELQARHEHYWLFSAPAG